MKTINLTLQSIPSTLITEVLLDSILDGVVLDTEHGYYNNETLVSCIQVATLMNKVCIVRFTDLNKQLIRMCLDAGADGVIFSTVEDAETAASMVEYCNYPSFGGKRGSALVRENKWGDLKMSNRKPIIIAQLETKKAVDNIESIMQCGFDAYVIGPYDLSASLGCVADWNNKLYVDYINKLFDTIPSDELGAFLPSKKDITLFQQSGRHRPALLVWGLDVDYIRQGIKDITITK